MWRWPEITWTREVYWKIWYSVLPVLKLGLFFDFFCADKNWDTTTHQARWPGEMSSGMEKFGTQLLLFRCFPAISLVQFSLWWLLCLTIPRPGISLCLQWHDNYGPIGRWTEDTFSLLIRTWVPLLIHGLIQKTAWWMSFPQISPESSRLRVVEWDRIY